MGILKRRRVLLLAAIAGVVTLSMINKVCVMRAASARILQQDVGLPVNACLHTSQDLAQKYLLQLALTVPLDKQFSHLLSQPTLAEVEGHMDVMECHRVSRLNLSSSVNAYGRGMHACDFTHAGRACPPPDPLVTI